MAGFIGEALVASGQFLYPGKALLGARNEPIMVCRAYDPGYTRSLKCYEINFGLNRFNC